MSINFSLEMDGAMCKRLRGKADDLIHLHIPAAEKSLQAYRDQYVAIIEALASHEVAEKMKRGAA
jgi:hypothetical protein